MNPIDLKKYIKWTNSFESKIILREIISKDFDGFLTEYNLDLTFGIDVNEIKRPGFEFLPPTPSSFTFKFSPIFGKRDEEALNVLKRKTAEKLKVESNLFSTIRNEKSEYFINYDEI